MANTRPESAPFISRHYIMDNKYQAPRFNSHIYGHTGDPDTLPRSLGMLEYDQTFGAAGKLRLGNNNGWASCILSSTAKPDYFLATYYETLNTTVPERRYAARVARFDTAGNLDTSFGDSGTGSIEAHFTGALGRISILDGLHETEAGEIFNWGTIAWIDNSAIYKTFAITKRLSSGTLDSSFGLEGKVDIHTLVDFDAQLVGGNACIVSSTAIFIGIGEFNKSPPNYHILRLTPEGALDPTFQNGGILTPRHPDYPNKLISIVGLSQSQDGGILVCGTTHRSDGAGMSGLIMKFDNGGNIDKSFGTNGFSETRILGQFPEFYSVCNAPPLMLVAGTSTTKQGPESLVGLYSAIGSPDESFNGGEPAVHAFIDPPYLDKWHQANVAAQTPGKVIAVGSWDLPTSSGPVVGRFNMDGSVDEAFMPGLTKFGTLTDANFFSNASTGFVQLSPDRILVAGVTGGKPAILAIKV